MLLSPWLDGGLLAILGLSIGSFLNVVIYRLPKMMERQWAVECAELSGSAAPVGDTFNLMLPRSRCQNCGHQIRWHENIPVLSYLLLRGKCAQCKTPFSLRYPAVELATALLFLFCGQRWGITPAGLLWCGFSAAMVALAMIDWDTTLLPDDITLPLLWAGLVAAAVHWTQLPLASAVWGCVAGYLSLWSIYWAFKLITGKEGVGHGDFKLFAAMGAWFGWNALIPMILMASVIGAIIGITLKLTNGLREGGQMPFGPFLVGAGLTAMLFGPESILRLAGLQ